MTLEQQRDLELQVINEWTVDSVIERLVHRMYDLSQVNTMPGENAYDFVPYEKTYQNLILHPSLPKLPLSDFEAELVEVKNTELSRVEKKFDKLIKERDIKLRIDALDEYTIAVSCPVPNSELWIKQLIAENAVDTVTLMEGLNSSFLEERAANEYIEKREKEYPSVKEMIVALWESVVEKRPAEMEKLQAKREAIKLKYPKV